MQQQTPRKTTLSIPEALAVGCICFGLFIYASYRAVLADFPAAQFTDAAAIDLIFMETVLAALALVFLHLRGFDIASLIPRPTLRGTRLGIVVFFATWVIDMVVSALISTPSSNQSIEFSFARISLPAILAMSIVNGAYEEVFLLGVLVRGLRGFGLSVAVGVPLLIRVLYHAYQGPFGVVSILMFGLCVTASYLASGRLWPAVLAHMLGDIVPMLLG